MMIQNTLTMVMCFSFILLLSEWRYTKRVTAAVSTTTLVVMVLLNIVPLTLVERNPALRGFGMEFTTCTINLLLVLIITLVLSKYRDGGTVFVTLTATLFSNITVITSNGFSLFCENLALILTIKLLTYALILYYVVHFLRAPMLQLRAYMGRHWLMLCLLPFSMLLALFLLLIYPTNMYSQPKNLPATAVLSGICLLLYGLIYALFRQLRLQYQKDDDNMLMQLLADKVEAMVGEEERLRIFRHDLRHYTRILLHLLDSGDDNGAREVLTTMEQSLDCTKVTQVVGRYTGDVLIDSVLSSYAAQAAVDDVTFTVQLESPEDFPVEPLELAVVIANALENAEHAARRVEQGQTRAMRLCGGRNGSQFFLEFSNTYTGKLKFSPDTQLPVTDETGHGYGTRSVAVFVRKYHAMLDCHTENGWFFIRILI